MHADTGRERKKGGTGAHILSSSGESTHLAAELAGVLGVLTDLMLLDDLCTGVTEEAEVREQGRRACLWKWATLHVFCKHSTLAGDLEEFTTLTSQTGTVAGTCEQVNGAGAVRMPCVSKGGQSSSQFS